MHTLIPDTIRLLHYAGVFILMALFATELIMPLAGFLAWHGGMNLAGVIAAGTLGSMLGSVVFYYLTRFVDHGRVYRLAGSHGRYLGVSAGTIRHAERWFDRHAGASVLIGHIFPGLRTAMSLVPGYRRMRLLPFLAWTLPGTALSAAALAGLGYYVSGRFEAVQTSAIYASNVFLSVLLVCLLAYAYYRHRKYSRQTRQDQPD